ncbi:hypothetical protein UFOVP276_186 [uncultured Caudovirales phage]|uniref:Lipoprotein n=1 Tax=uncultured Caudovirales phage TaxID=2100421 RepID=A0A6J5LDG1_9CAUD|nr:hypothetical protein UFOVP127_80 [uncultured Caudovirales phage]CAB4135230.1 hypothetical protein UFOVP276_186 [uncultured Caudovirales phage]
MRVPYCIAAIVGILLATGCVTSCVHVRPAPTGDAFYGITADCSLPVVAQQSGLIRDEVRKCLDTDTAVCLVGLSNIVAKDTIVCVVQDFDMTLHRKMALGTASESMKIEAMAASAWIKAEQVGIRN